MMVDAWSRLVLCAGIVPWLTRGRVLWIYFSWYFRPHCLCPFRILSEFISGFYLLPSAHILSQCLLLPIALPSPLLCECLMLSFYTLWGAQLREIFYFTCQNLYAYDSGFYLFTWPEDLFGVLTKFCHSALPSSVFSKCHFIRFIGTLRFILLRK